MKKRIIYFGTTLLLLFVLPQQKADAQIIDLINQAIIKAINAIDIKVQQVQNQTIMLQNAEKQLENKMSLGNLNDISGWLDKEKNLYADYYNELQQVKTVIADFNEVKRITTQQAQLVSEYKSAYSLFKQDKHFSSDEIGYMGQVYSGILQESVRNLDEVLLAVNSFGTQMSDAERLLLVHQASGGIQKNLNDLRQFNNNNTQVAMQRAKDQNDLQSIRALYGIQ
ncbi:hypothetical protein BDD43_0817 [Mucilaginibacter gracilis]|uniref:Conjugal transfer protein TraI n=1 Tax=Mucilaginibacter gracilis TaxID=423350 RepID=A0A495IVA8_9SPHI|nr:conjugal transfer protein TraI [Mucilaginibacter gracilis]RKR80685.1 hypothetical protein BDD43_0817 [Mucilaginibacter gracilis]